MKRHITFTKYGREWNVPDAFYRVSSKLIIKNDQDELLVLRDVEDGDHEIPGGGVDWGENYTQALERELNEELAVKLVSVDKVPFATEYAIHKKGYRTVKIYYFGTVKGDVSNNEPDKTTLTWVTKDQFRTLNMQSEEAGIQKHIDTIWPTGS